MCRGSRDNGCDRSRRETEAEEWEEHLPAPGGGGGGGARERDGGVLGTKERGFEEGC